MGFQLQFEDGARKPVDKALSGALKEPGLVCLRGASGSGKSWALQRACAARPDLKPIRIFVPTVRAHQSALEQLAGALRERGDESVLIVDDPSASWDAKVAAVCKPLVALNGSALLLIDNADRIEAPGPSDIADDTLPDESAVARRQLVASIVEIANSVRVVATASNANSLVATDAGIRLRVTGAGPLAPDEVNVAAGDRPREWPLLVEMCGYRPLWIRIAAGLLRAGRTFTQVAGVIASADEEATPAPLIDAALDLVGSRTDLWDTLVVFAAAEEALPLKEAIDLAGIDRKAVHRLRELGLVDSIVSKHVRVHENIRLRIKARGGVAEATVQQALGHRAENLYLAEPMNGFTEAGLRHRRAAADHFIEAGLVEETRRNSGGFVGPILDLGRRLGIRARDAERAHDRHKALALYQSAVSAYGAAISYGGRLPYPVHYRAWNLFRTVKVGGAPIDMGGVVRDLRESALAASTQPWYWRRLAMVQLDRGEQDAAITTIREALSRVAADRARDELAAPVVSALRQRRQIKAAQALAEFVIERTSEPGIALDLELALLLRIEGKRFEATRYLAAKLRRMGSLISDSLRATLIAWLEEDGQVSEASRWKADAAVEIQPSALAPIAQPGTAIPPIPPEGTRWILLRDGLVIRESDDAAQLTAGIPAEERHRYLALLRESVKDAGSPKG